MGVDSSAAGLPLMTTHTRLGRAELVGANQVMPVAAASRPSATKEAMAAWRRWSPAVWAAFRRAVVSRSASPVRGLRADLVEPSWIPIGGPVGPVGAKYQRTQRGGEEDADRDPPGCRDAAHVLRRLADQDGADQAGEGGQPAGPLFGSAADQVKPGGLVAVQ